MKFTKMQGIGNDYVYMDTFTETIENPGRLAKAISDRHFGVGSDGLILIKPSEKADFYMDMYNSDGSQGAMCGNGIRCVAKYVYDAGLTDKTQLAIDTKSGIKYLDLTVENGKVTVVRVNMGHPELIPSKIPFISDRDIAVSEPIEVGDKTYEITAVSMGNPHGVVYYEDDLADLEIEKIGPQFETHPRFPERVNTEFYQVIDEDTLAMRVWERGAGETMACGTGACAVLVAAVLNKKIKPKANVQLLGGILTIEWDQEKNLIYMTGPAETVFTGEYEEK